MKMWVYVSKISTKWNFLKKKWNHLGLFLQGYLIWKFSHSCFSCSTRNSLQLLHCPLPADLKAMVVWILIYDNLACTHWDSWNTGSSWEIFKDYEHDSSTGASSAQNVIEAHRKWSDIGFSDQMVSFAAFFFGIWNFQQSWDESVEKQVAEIKELILGTSVLPLILGVAGLPKCDDTWWWVGIPPWYLWGKFVSLKRFG